MCVLELLISILAEHEKKLDGLVQRLEVVTPPIMVLCIEVVVVG